MTSSTTPIAVEVVAPIAGTVIDITDVPDPVAARGSFPVPARSSIGLHLPALMGMNNFW